MLLVTMYPGQKLIVEGEEVSITKLDSLNHGGEIQVTNDRGISTHIALYVADEGFKLTCGAMLYFVAVFNGKGQGRIGVDSKETLDIIFP